MTAYVTQFRNETIAAFMQKQSFLRAAVTTESVVKGNTATFMVAGSPTATATTRGANGLIPARSNDRTQYSATLTEWNDLVQETNYNMFAQQGDGNKIMQDDVVATLNRKIDQDILTELANATQDAGSAATASLALVVRAKTILGNAQVPVEEEDNMFFVASWAFEAYLNQINAFTSADFVDVKPLVGPAKRMRRWLGFNWIFHSNIQGAGTAAELCYAFHRNAIGHAMDTTQLDVQAGYDPEQNYSWARASTFMGSKLLQNTGIVKVTHDGSAYVAT
jgi:hypothetical protein